eukprot:GHVT01040663.1.p1 GENE.GHVT01040663.1~~GHVT01040663.1.p1  ORF type:complete len:527 (-),score=98.53 GHVT01040663.1:1500-3080(-)
MTCVSNDTASLPSSASCFPNGVESQAADATAWTALLEEDQWRAEARARLEASHGSATGSSSTSGPAQDRSLARVQKLINRLKKISEADRDVLLKEIQQVYLGMFLSETADTLAETQFKAKDTRIVVQVILELHARYEDIGTLILRALVQAFITESQAICCATNAPAPVVSACLSPLAALGAKEGGSGSSSSSSNSLCPLPSTFSSDEAFRFGTDKGKSWSVACTISSSPCLSLPPQPPSSISSWEPDSAAAAAAIAASVAALSSASPNRLTSAVQRRRLLLRLAGELHLVGFLPPKTLLALVTSAAAFTKPAHVPNEKLPTSLKHPLAQAVSAAWPGCLAFALASTIALEHFGKKFGIPLLAQLPHSQQLVPQKENDKHLHTSQPKVDAIRLVSSSSLSLSSSCLASYSSSICSSASSPSASPVGDAEKSISSGASEIYTGARSLPAAVHSDGPAGKDAVGEKSSLGPADKKANQSGGEAADGQTKDGRPSVACKAAQETQGISIQCATTPEVQEYLRLVYVQTVR